LIIRTLFIPRVEKPFYEAGSCQEEFET
jgi:hypothetical protein